MISSSPTDLQPVLEAMAENAVRLCGASLRRHLSDVEGEQLQLVARHGRSPSDTESHPRCVPDVGRRPGVLDRRGDPTIGTSRSDVADSRVPVAQRARAGAGIRTMLAIPLLREGKPIGVIFVIGGPRSGPSRPSRSRSWRRSPTRRSSRSRTCGCSPSWRRRTGAHEAHAQVTEALEQQTATSEILRVISSSPTDLAAGHGGHRREMPSACAARVDQALFGRGGGSVGSGGWRRLARPLVPRAAPPSAASSPSGRAMLDRRTIARRGRPT